MSMSSAVAGQFHFDFDSSFNVPVLGAGRRIYCRGKGALIRGEHP